MSLELSMTELELAMRKLANTVKLDTIEACAKIAEDYDGKGLDARGYSADLGDARMTQDHIVKAIRALAVSRPSRGGPDA
jgi:hypothetical protein